jgi:Putative peptidoglycan binding domain
MSSFGTRPSFRPSISSRPAIRSVAPSTRSSSRLTNRSVTPSVRSSTAISRQQARSPGNRVTQVSGSTNRSINRSVRGAGTPRQLGLNGRIDHVYQRRAADSHPDWDRRRPHFEGNHWWAFNGYSWIGLDADYFPWDYYPYYTYDYYPYDYVIGDDSSDVPPQYQGLTTTAPAPDSTVKAVQAQLSQQGFYGGTIDGLFGPSTRDAVARYQAKQNLTVTGSLTSETLQALGLPSVATN